MNKGKEMPFWRKGDFYLVVLFFMISMMFVIGALEFPRISRIFPLLVGSLCLLLLTADILQFLVPKFGNQFRSLKGGELFETHATQNVEAVYQERRAPAKKQEIVRPVSILKTILWFFVGYIIFYVLGYLPFATLFLFLFLKFYSSVSLKMSALLAVSTCLFLGVLFSFVLGLDIFQGSILLYGLL